MWKEEKEGGRQQAGRWQAWQAGEKMGRAVEGRRG